jgi:hypothetical protein
MCICHNTEYAGKPPCRVIDQGYNDDNVDDDDAVDDDFNVDKLAKETTKKITCRNATSLHK